MFGRVVDESIESRSGFSLAELMFVVLIIGILIAIVMPVFAQATSHAEKKTCFANQRTIESAVQLWQSGSLETDLSELAGPVNASHELITGHYIKRPPYCPSAGHPVDIDNPTASEGIYTLDSSGTVDPCGYGSLGPHGSFHSQ